MTLDEYEQLKKWCLSSVNKGRADYAQKYELKKKAVALWLMITGYRKTIQIFFNALERAQDEKKISYYRSRLEETKDAKRKVLKEFEDLKYF